jgi:hypothetical protein
MDFVLLWLRRRRRWSNVLWDPCLSHDVLVLTEDRGVSNKCMSHQLLEFTALIWHWDGIVGLLEVPH